MRRNTIPGFATIATVALLAATLTTRTGPSEDAATSEVPTTTASSTSETQSTTTARHIALSGVPTTKAAAPARTVRTEQSFSMVGLTWQGAAPDTISVRHHERDGWSDWTRLDPAGAAPGAAPAAAPGASEPLWTGPTTSVQVRATRAGQDVGSQLDLVAIRPARTPAPASRTTAPRTAAPERSERSGRPPIVSRAEWGADESLMTWPPEYTTTTKAVIVHHTAETNDYTCEQSAEIVRGIYYYHAVELGWGDIGYQALVDKCGTIFAGRTDGIDNHVVGGHARGFNGQTFGVSMLGTYNTVTPAQAMIDSVGALAGWKLGTTGVGATDEITLISGGGEGNKYPQGTEVTLPAIFAHRDVNETACPGDRGYARLPEIRDIAAAQQAGSAQSGT